MEQLSYGYFERLISHFKFLSGLDIGEKRRPQNGSMDIMIQQKILHLRLSTLPSAYTESLAIRLLPQEETIDMHHLSLFPESVDQLCNLMVRASGLILFTGPTGSGKTTILYSLLQYIQSQMKRQIVTLEDPVEKKVDSFLQMEINEKAGITYGEGFKSILRHDPDVIMIGEIRDEETAKLVLRASLTGHLVLSTVHARDSVGCLYRLLELGFTYRELEQTLLGVVSQRLVLTKCPYCKEECHPVCFRRRKMKRMGVYEVLAERDLENVLRWMEGASFGDHVKYKTIKHYIQQGIALGFLPESSYEKWIGE